jgi:uncharacterized protein (DUF58 family)
VREWSKQTFKAESATYLLAFVVFLSIWNYFMLSITLSIMLVSIIVIFIIVHFYHKFATLDLENKKKIVRLFPEETISLPLRISGKSIVPMYFGKLSYRMNNAARVENALSEINRKEYTEYYSDISSGKKEHELRIHALKRGRAVLKQIEIQLYDPLFIANSSFTYRPFFGTEILILPKPKPVVGVERLVTNEVGNQPNMYSYFQDPLLISGTRGYEPTDSFQQIHWKASARTGQLQTKILEKTTHLKWTILLNVLEEERNDLHHFYFSEHLENHISHIAYLFQVAEKQGISFELFVNIVAKNQLQLFTLEEGTGKEQLIRGLELLARIDSASPTMRLDRFLKKIEPKFSQSSCVILCGLSKQDVVKSTTTVRHLSFFELASSDDKGVLKRC